jgi:hypothetical protein
MYMRAGRDRLQEASRDGGRTRRAVHEGLYTKEGMWPVVYVPNHEVVGLSVVGLGTSLPKMRWVVYDPPTEQGLPLGFLPFPSARIRIWL